jgi:hypothetical protein
VQIALLFLRFVEETEIGTLMATISEKELLEVLHSFQKGKSSGLDGWPIEF